MNHEVVARPMAVRTGLAEACQRAINQLWIAAAEACLIQPVLEQPANLEVFDEDIGAPGQFAHGPLSWSGRDVDGNRAFVAIAGEKIGGIATAAIGAFNERRTPVAGVVASSGALDLDNSGAEVREDLGAPGAGQNARQIDNANSGQRSGHRGLLEGWCGPQLGTGSCGQQTIAAPGVWSGAAEGSRNWRCSGVDQLNEANDFLALGGGVENVVELPISQCDV